MPAATARFTNGWARRITGTCLSPGCGEEAASEHDLRWCPEHGDVLKAVARELRGGTEYGRTIVKPAKPAPVVVRQLPGYEPVPEGMCHERCGRPARPSRQRCKWCKVGQRMPKCVREGCDGPDRGKYGGRCYQCQNKEA